MGVRTRGTPAPLCVSGRGPPRCTASSPSDTTHTDDQDPYSTKIRREGGSTRGNSKLCAMDYFHPTHTHPSHYTPTSLLSPSRIKRVQLRKYFKTSSATGPRNKDLTKRPLPTCTGPQAKAQKKKGDKSSRTVKTTPKVWRDLRGPPRTPRPSPDLSWVEGT